MRKFFLFLAAVLIAFSECLTSAQSAPQPQPKLVLLVVIDQFRYDYLTRFREEYSGGFRRVLTHGAVFENANLAHYPTVTATGHSTVLSGATPALSGIMGNDWYDRESHKQVFSISDDSVNMLGGGGPGASPRRLLVSTVGDELKMARPEATHVFGVALKDRGAILPVGHMADAAYWYDRNTGNFVSSTYYLPDLPGWVKSFNGGRPAEKFAGAEWGGANARKHLPGAPGPALYAAIFDSPFGNELVEAFAEKLIAEEKIGQHPATDLLSVSFSSNDAVGHTFGPYSPEVHDISIRTDRVLEKLFVYLDGRLGMQNVLVVFTSDHGVAPVPEDLARWKMPGGRMSSADLFGPIKQALNTKFGNGDWILGTAGTSPYLNLNLIREKSLNEAEVRRVAAEAAAAVPHVLRVYTRDQLQTGAVRNDLITARVAASFNAKRSGDLEILLEPYWIRSAEGTSHGAPYSYDAHIPLIFMGPWFRAGVYAQNVVLNDVAPTLTTILGVETPSGSVGRALNEIIESRMSPLNAAK